MNVISMGKSSINKPFEWRNISAVLACVVILILLSHGPASAQKTKQDPLIVGGDFNYPPYEYLDPAGNPTGLNVDLTKAIARVSGLELQVELGPWETIRKKLEAGEIDAIQGMFYSVARNAVVDFSPPHSSVTHVVFARKDTPMVQSIESLQGQQVVVMSGDIMHDFALRHGLEKTLHTTATQADALREVAAGNQDYALVAELPGLYWKDQLGLKNIKIASPPIATHAYCYAVPSGQEELLARLDEALAILKRTGEYREIREKWLGPLEHPGITYKNLFKYSLLAITPLLLMAIAVIAWNKSLRKAVDDKTRELKASEQRFRTIFDHFPRGVLFIYDKDIRFIYAGGEAIGILNSREEQLAGKTLWQIFPSDIASYIEPFFRKTLLGIQQTIEVEINDQIFEIFTIPMNENNSGDRLCIGLAVIATERIHYLKKTTKITEQLELAIQNTRIGIWDYDIRSGKVDWKGAHASLFGIHDHDFKGTMDEMLNYVHPGDRPKNISDLNISLKDKKEVDNKYRVVRPDGSVRWMHSFGRIVFDESGDPMRVIGTTQDISERIEHENALKESKERFKSYVENANDIIYHISAETGLFDYISPSWKSIVGHEPDDIVGTSFREYVHPEDVEACQKFLDIVIETGQRQSGVEYRVMHKDGRWRWHTSNAGPMYDSNGVLIGFLGIARDVTDKKESERLKEEVERIMHHDLKSPLNGVIGLSQFLESDDGLTIEQRELAATVKECGFRLLRMVNQSIDLYKIESGNYEYLPKAVDIIAILKEVIRYFSNQASSKKTQILLLGADYTNLDHQNIVLLGEEMLLYSIFSNLIHNALEASPQETNIVITVETGNECKVMIRNQGAVPHEIRRHFFEKYTTFGKKGGTGIGTYSAKLMVEAMDGEIRLEALEATTAVIITLPL